MEISRAPSEFPDPRRPQTGPYTVTAAETVVLHDRNRDKDLQLRVTYPREGGKFPLIVFSHGNFGTKDAYPPLIQYWASQGYVCIQANHSDARTLSGQTVRDIRENRDRAAKIAVRDWRNRPRDVSFILDSLDVLEHKIPALQDKVNRSRIGVGGHSFGAHTAQLVGGATVITDRWGQQRGSFKDDRVNVVLLISPQGRGEMLDEHSWDRLDIPAMIITGSNDVSGRTGKDVNWRMEPYRFSPPGNKYLVFIKGASHNFGGISGVNRPALLGLHNENYVNYVRVMTTNFWDAYLKDDRRARAFLCSSFAREVTRGELTIEDR